jgi:hypothetical protein
MVQNIFLWSAPLLVIPASFIVNRYLPFKRARYYLYAAILTAAFFFNLFRVSFLNEIFDTCLFIAVNFILADFFWNILHVKARMLVVWVVVLGFILFGGIHLRWLYAGYGNAWKLWNPSTVSSYALGDVQYAVKDRDLFFIRKPARELKLVRRLGKWPLEKHISSYRTPEGFSRTNFSYIWTETGLGVRVDLRTAGYILWTMGEGF